ncbi:hypothetical protein BJX99DRAFT_258457 [Aspergillus californicus]
MRNLEQLKKYLISRFPRKRDTNPGRHCGEDRCLCNFPSHWRCTFAAITYSIFSREHWRAGENFTQGRSVTELAFLDHRTSRGRATVLFVDILRAIFNHPDWSQLHTFFSTRYAEDQQDVDPFDTTFSHDESSLVHFRTDLESVNLPKDLPTLLTTAGDTSRCGVLGPDLQPCAIGPAISVSCGTGGYMDLVYAGLPPAEWAALCTVIAEWVYEQNSTALGLGILWKYSFKGKVSDEECRACDQARKIQREYLQTYGIGAADAIRDVFSQLAGTPLRFQGIEWDFLVLCVPNEVQEVVYARFGERVPYSDSIAMHADLFSRLAGRVNREYMTRSAAAHGNNGGYVVIVETVFQAHWDPASPLSKEEQKRSLLISWICQGERGRKQYFFVPRNHAEIPAYIPRDLLTPAQHEVDGGLTNTLWIRTWFGAKDNADSQAAADQSYEKLHFYTLRQCEDESYDIWLVDKSFIYECRDIDTPDIQDGNVLARPWSTPPWLLDAFMRCPSQLCGRSSLGEDLESDEADGKQRLLVAVADRKVCEEGWVLLVAINHKGRILPLRVRDKAREVDLVINEWNNDYAPLTEMGPHVGEEGEELYLNNGDGWE